MLNRDAMRPIAWRGPHHNRASIGPLRTAVIAEKLINNHLQLLEIYRFRKVCVEPRLFVPANVLVHPKPCQRYSRDGGALTDLPDQVDAGTVRQSNVAQQQ